MYMTQLADTLVNLQTLVCSNTVTKKIEGKDSADTTRPAPIEYNIGNIVAYGDTNGFGRTHKLKALWTGPFEIIEKTSTQAFTIKNAEKKHGITRILPKSCATGSNWRRDYFFCLIVLFALINFSFLVKP
ncbi:hypothetical protein DSO57_1034902 [Entomophthora muscae]|uniref:Uncharacterized protein n=1 Tax=Entomophthora muscae TaxID=34485 RepID=A0ACC2SNY5_9FUNG|nr:hypothetical protein DSO57_1034902 [Entomophthora muscae]